MSGRHRSIQPEGLPKARGYSHAVSADAGRTIWIAGQLGVDETGAVVSGGFGPQFDRALGNVVASVRAAGGEPDHIVSMQIFTTDVDAYLKAASTDLGAAWQVHMGRHYPAMALLGVSALVDQEALIEIMATAVVPDE